MKRKKRGSYPGIQIGTSYLLVIFVILCLVTFATLSLSSAKRDQSYSQQLAGRETAYCEANAKAAQIMARDPGRSGKGNAEGCKMERVSI